MQSLSGGCHLYILLSLFIGHYGRIIVKVILSERLTDAEITVVRLTVTVEIPEIIIDLLHHNSRRQIIDSSIHNQVESLDLRLIPDSFGNIMCKRPVTFFSGIIGHIIHCAFVCQNIPVDFRRMMSDKIAASAVHDVLTTFVPRFLRRHICGNIINFQFTDIHILANPVIVEKTPVGKDDRTVLSGGKDTLLGVVDSVRQRIDIVSAALDIGDILDISLDRKAAVREFLTQISLDTHIIYLSVHLYAVADTVRIEPLQISKFPVDKRLPVFFNDILPVFLERNASYRFFTQHAGMSQIMKNVFIRIVHPLTDLRHFLDLPQRSVRLFQLAFHVTSLGDVAILAEHHVIIRMHDAFKIINIFL